MIYNYSLSILIDHKSLLKDVFVSGKLTGTCYYIIIQNSIVSSTRYSFMEAGPLVC